MERTRLEALLRRVADGELTPDDAARAIAHAPFTDHGDLRLDHHRSFRTGEPEVVFAEGKTPEQTARALAGLLEAGDGPVLATRASTAHAEASLAAVPTATYDEVGRVIVARRAAEPTPGLVAVVAAGTSDLPVLAECATTLDAFGIAIDRITDVGIAGLHRLLDVKERLYAADVVVVAAGMEGALPTAVASLVHAPVVAVPTSVGYGAAFDGLAALLGMLTSCAPGISVVNIDNGFGAALVARRTLRTAPSTPPSGTDAAGTTGHPEQP